MLEIVWSNPNKRTATSHPVNKGDTADAVRAERTLLILNRTPNLNSLSVTNGKEAFLVSGTLDRHPVIDSVEKTK